MLTHNLNQQNKILILLAAGFEETAVAYCLDNMREAGLPISLVGLSAGILKSWHGLAVRPDYSLDQLTPEAANRGIIVPGGPQCVSALLTDPRIHQLLDATLQRGGFVAVLATAVPAFTQSAFLSATSDKHLLHQGEMDIREFTGYLIDFASH